MNNTRIVRATRDDTATIERLARLTWPATFRDILGADQIEYMLDMMYSPRALEAQMDAGHEFHLLLLADPVEPDTYAGGSLRFRAVGYVSHQLQAVPGATKIHKLYVLPAYHGRGLGRQLIDKVENLARRAGQSALKLDVNYQNRAISFYEHLGFERVERFDTRIGGGYLMEDWRMVKLLRPYDDPGI